MSDVVTDQLDVADWSSRFDCHDQNAHATIFPRLISDASPGFSYAHAEQALVPRQAMQAASTQLQCEVVSFVVPCREPPRMAHERCPMRHVLHHVELRRWREIRVRQQGDDALDNIAQLLRGTRTFLQNYACASSYKCTRVVLERGAGMWPWKRTYTAALITPLH